jgi:predicted RNase H-like nuclease
MSLKEIFQVAGVDGCKAGWLVAVVEATRQSEYLFEPKRLFVAEDFAAVLSATVDCEIICVDIPIGLSDGPPRQCDPEARRILSPFRASSVFPPPIRPCLSAKDYKTACRICYEYSGRKLTRQSFAIMDKIRQVDDLITPELQKRVREIHPEILFWALNNKKPMQYNKKKAPGRNERMKLLAPIFPNIEEFVVQARKPKEVELDDILDALVAAWTAGQTVLQKAKTLPDNPELDSKGLKMEIVYPA